MSKSAQTEGDDLSTTQPSALHQQDRRTPVGEGRIADRRELVDARAIHVGPPLLRPAKNRRGVDLDEILFDSPADE